MARRASVDSEAMTTAIGSGDERLDKLPGLAARIDSANAKSAGARSDTGNLYKEAEDQGFHRRALKDAIRLRNMEPEMRRDYLSSLNAYCDKLGIWNQGDLFDEQPKPPSAPLLVDADESAATTARCIGKSDGLAGTRHSAHLYQQGAARHAEYEIGWQEGQRELVEKQHDIDLIEPKANGSRRGRKAKADDDQPSA